ncbi:response regulator [Aliarcobacter cryaerophilus]|uniref:response regulator n=1 Tax=Aliarcobacter cryaerophilus TaxID=28198 RepID=UPI003DA4AE20
MRFLLVEDEEFNLIVLEEMIKILYPDAKILKASNGQEACDILSENSFDLILSDINMPIMDGYTFIKKIKNELLLATPTVAVTAFAIQGDKEKLLMAGFDYYISKPIDMAELHKVLKVSLLD